MIFVIEDKSLAFSASISANRSSSIILFFRFARTTLGMVLGLEFMPVSAMCDFIFSSRFL